MVTLELACEQERIRRISERLLLDRSESAEAARESRARQVALLYRQTLVDGLRHNNCSAASCQAVEERLQERRRSVLKQLALAAEATVVPAASPVTPQGTPQSRTRGCRITQMATPSKALRSGGGGETPLAAQRSPAPWGSPRLMRRTQPTPQQSRTSPRLMRRTLTPTGRSGATSTPLRSGPGAAATLQPAAPNVRAGGRASFPQRQTISPARGSRTGAASPRLSTAAAATAAVQCGRPLPGHPTTFSPPRIRRQASFAKAASPISSSRAILLSGRQSPAASQRALSQRALSPRANTLSRNDLTPHRSRQTVASYSSHTPPRVTAAAPSAAATAETEGTSGAAATIRAEMNAKIEQMKMEILRIRAEESHLIRDMERRQRQKQEEEAKDEARQITEWREQLAMGMKQGLEEKSREQRVRELEDAKDFQQFKRDIKMIMREREQEGQREQLAINLDHARFRNDQQLAVAASDKLVLTDNINTQQELRNLRLAETIRQKECEQQERAEEAHLELDFKVKQMVAARNKALRSLQVSECSKHMPLARRG